MIKKIYWRNRLINDHLFICPTCYSRDTEIGDVNVEEDYLAFQLCCWDCENTNDLTYPKSEVSSDLPTLGGMTCMKIIGDPSLNLWNLLSSLDKSIIRTSLTTREKQDEALRLIVESGLSINEAIKCASQ